MPLQQGAVQGYDFNRMVVEFTMLNQSKVIFCAISTASIMRRSAACRRGAEVVGPAATTTEAERLLSEHAPDVALVDFHLRGANCPTA